MERRIRIRAGRIEVEATLDESITAKKVYEALPIDGVVNTWGDEVYFEIPVVADLDETARDVVERGDLGYWPTGRAFCIFFGPTPMSRGDEIRPASAVNVCGRLHSDPALLIKVKSGEAIRIERNSHHDGSDL